MNTDKMIDQLTKQFEAALQLEETETLNELRKEPKVIHVSAETTQKIKDLLGFEKLQPVDLNILDEEEKRIFFIHLDNLIREKKRGRPG